MLKRLIYFSCLFFLLVSGSAGAEQNANPSQPSDSAPPKPLDFSVIEQKAREQAAQPYSPQESALPPFLSNLSYDQYRDIRYKPEATLWQEEGLPFQLQFFHRGFMFKEQVTIHIIDNSLTHTIAYSDNLFNFGNNQFHKPLPSDLGFAGFRILYPLRKGKQLDEICAFLGASYFRAVGLGQVYGLSTRGLAIDTGLAKAEEFPLFKEFWIEKPGKNSAELTVYALLDSPSITGAYRFIIRPGLETIIEVKSHLFFRKGVERLGMAPLTSMFFRGENTDYFIDDFRPEIHDSDGLLIGRGNGEWVWRPLNNPHKLRISVFGDDNPVGFGLMQRDRNYDHYQDTEAKYHLRPSAWVERVGDWGQGAIYLLEIPSNAERHDNITAFWVANQPADEGQERIFEYRLHFLLDDSPEPAGGGRILASRTGSGGADGDSQRRKFVVDFAGEALSLLSPQAPIEAHVETTPGRIFNLVVYKNPITRNWRLSFKLDPGSEELVDLRAYLKAGEETLSETWIYQWSKP